MWDCRTSCELHLGLCSIPCTRCGICGTDAWRDARCLTRCGTVALLVKADGPSVRLTHQPGRVDPGERGLLVVVGGVAGDADRAEQGAVGRLDQYAARH